MQTISGSPGTALSPEFRLAIAACVWPRSHDHTQRIQNAMLPGIDWDLFVRVVRRHRIDGLVFEAFDSASISLPDATYSALKAAAEHQANKSLIHAGETIRMSRLLL